jgi:hypothetical protein
LRRPLKRRGIELVDAGVRVQRIIRLVRLIKRV